jgi:hypothetical protein
MHPPSLLANRAGWHLTGGAGSGRPVASLRGSRRAPAATHCKPGGPEVSIPRWDLMRGRRGGNPPGECCVSAFGEQPAGRGGRRAAQGGASKPRSNADVGLPRDVNLRGDGAAPAVLVTSGAARSVAEIGMFFALGLLVFPSQLGAVGMRGTVLALVVAFVARPLAAFLLPQGGALPTASGSCSGGPAYAEQSLSRSRPSRSSWASRGAWSSSTSSSSPCSFRH